MLAALNSINHLPQLRSRPPHTEISQTMSVISDTLSPARAKDYYFVLCLKPSSSPASSPPQLIGAMGTIKNNIGFILHPSYWRKGIGSEGMVGFLKSFWETQDVGGIEADVDPRNNASLRLLEKFGFVETGRESDTFQTHMGSCNSVYLRLERPKGKSEAQGQTDKERE